MVQLEILYKYTVYFRRILAQFGPDFGRQEAEHGRYGMDDLRHARLAGRGQDLYQQKLG